MDRNQSGPSGKNGPKIFANVVQQEYNNKKC